MCYTTGSDRAFLLVASQEGLLKVQLDLTQLEAAMSVDRASNYIRTLTADIHQETIYSVVSDSSSTKMWSSKLSDANHSVVGHCASARVLGHPTTVLLRVLYEPYLKTDVQNLGVPSPKTWSRKTAYFWVVLRRHHDIRAAVFGMIRA